MLFAGYAETFKTDIFPEQQEMTKEDYVIICGDFGGVWDKDKESTREKWWLDWLEAKSYTTLFVDGNHDISGGILELDDPNFRAKKKKLDQGFETYRINHLSWWEREMPSQEEMEEGKRNLEKNDYTVDFIVSHCSASSTAALISYGKYKPDTLTMYLEEIRQRTEFKKWFFGHYHENRNVNANEIMLYEQIIRIS